MGTSPYIDRFVQQRLEESLRDTPVVLIHGPRQCGKTTLARRHAKINDYAYFSFDDDDVRGAAKEDPVGFVAGMPDRVVFDEIQRVPELMLAIKLAVDRDRTPGRFILTGSANVLLVPNLSDSLAGRMAIVRLHPLSRCEIQGQDTGFLDQIATGDIKWSRTERLGDELAEIVAVGGYPEVLNRRSANRRLAWGRDYIETIVQRDIVELSRIKEQDVLPDLLTASATQSGSVYNLSDLAAPFQLSRPTIGDYVTLQERVFIVHRLRAWHSNLISRLTKAPKIHMGDTGIACAALDMTAGDLRADRQRCGHLTETFVVQELRRQASWHVRPPKFGHFRTRDGVEVDLVAEFGPRRVVGIEVKMSATVTAKDFRGLKKLQTELGERFRTGVVLYDGEDTLPFGEGMWAIPLRCVWERSSGFALA